MARRGYITGNFASGAGYDPGVGVHLEGQAKWRFLEMKLTGCTAWQKKKTATFGYVWGVSGQLRGYVWRGLYLAGAYNLAGYKSIFENDYFWKKHGDNWGGGGGWQTENFDINFFYFFKENSSPNRVQFAVANGQFRIWEWLWGMGSVKRMTFDQMYHGELERWSAWTYKIGIGIRW